MPMPTAARPHPLVTALREIARQLQHEDVRLKLLDLAVRLEAATRGKRRRAHAGPHTR